MRIRNASRQVQLYALSNAVMMMMMMMMMMLMCAGCGCHLPVQLLDASKHCLSDLHAALMSQLATTVR